MSEIIFKGDITEIEAATAAKDVDDCISRILDNESRLDNDYVELGNLLLEVHNKKLWEYLNYSSFGQYLKNLTEKYHRGRSQLYHYFTTVRDLQPFIDKKPLVQMGIAKAAEIRKSIKRTGFPPTADIIEKAISKEVTAAELRKILFEDEYPKEKGTWFDQEGFYVTPDERLVIQAADELAIRIDPAVEGDAPDWVKRKEARLRQAMEFLATHGDK